MEPLPQPPSSGSHSGIARSNQETCKPESKESRKFDRVVLVGGFL